jgi:UDP-glucose 4-epimerase
VRGSLKHLLVTGASGFLGSEIVAFARKSGWAVRALHRRPSAQVEGVENFQCDLRDTAQLSKATEGMTAIVHAAGLAHVFGSSAGDFNRFIEVNEIGTGNLIDAALQSGVPNVVLVSSVSVYGSYPGSECNETVPCHPRGAYAISKRRGELRAIERMARGPGSLVILRFTTIYGEGDRGNVAKLIDALDRGRFIWPGSGQNQKSLIYKEDAARACLCALDRPVSGTDVFNVSAQPATMKEIVTAICQALGRPVPRVGVPLSLLRAAGAISRVLGDPGRLDNRLQKFIHDDVYTAEKFENSFSFFPSISLSDGMHREVGSLRTRSRP